MGAFSYISYYPWLPEVFIFKGKALEHWLDCLLISGLYWKNLNVNLGDHFSWIFHFTRGEKRQWCNFSIHMGILSFKSIGSPPFVLRTGSSCISLVTYFWVALAMLGIGSIKVKTYGLWRYFSLSADLFSKWKTDFQNNISLFCCGLVFSPGFFYCWKINEIKSVFLLNSPSASLLSLCAYLKNILVWKI